MRIRKDANSFSCRILWILLIDWQLQATPLPMWRAFSPRDPSEEKKGSLCWSHRRSKCHTGQTTFRFHASFQAGNLKPESKFFNWLEGVKERTKGDSLSLYSFWKELCSEENPYKTDWIVSLVLCCFKLYLVFFSLFFFAFARQLETMSFKSIARVSILPRVQFL